MLKGQSEKTLKTIPEITDWILLFKREHGKANRRVASKTVIDFLFNPEQKTIVRPSYHFFIGGFIINGSPEYYENIFMSTGRIEELVKEDEKIVVITANKFFTIRYDDCSSGMSKMIKDVNSENGLSDEDGAYLEKSKWYLKGFNFF